MNGEALVPQGTDGTGAAFIYPNDAPHPSQIIMANRAFREQQKKEEEAKMAKTMEGLDKNLGTAWDVDVPYLEPIREDIVNAHAFHYKSGKDPMDPRNEDYWKLKNIRDQGGQKYAVSNQHQKMYEAHALNAKSPGYTDRYDVEAEDELWNAWRDMGPERANVKPPEHVKKAWDVAKYIKDFSTTINDPDVSEKYWSDKGLQQIVEQKTTFYSPERQAMYGQQARMNPDYDEWIQNQWDNNVAAGDKEAFEQKTIETNKQLKQKGILATVEPIDLYSAGKLSANFKTGKELSTHNMPSEDDDGDGSGGEQDAVAMLREYAALSLGASHIFQNQPLSYNEGGKALAEDQGGKVGDEFKLTQQLSGNQIGWVNYMDGDGVPSRKEDIVSDWKYMNGKVYVKSTRSIIERREGKRKTDWRQINNMWTEVLIPMLDAKYGAGANKEKRKIINAAKKMGVDLTEGEWKPELLYQEKNPYGVDEDPYGIKPK